MKYTIALAFMALLVWSSDEANAIEEKPKLKICYLEWGKYGGENLPSKGLVPDITTRVFIHAGYNVEVYIVPWPRCIEQTKRLKYDLVAGAWEGEGFDPYFEYMENVTVDSINFVTLESSQLTSGDMDYLEGKRIGFMRDSGGLENFKKNKHRFKVIEVAVEKRLLTMLKGDRFDAVISDPLQLIELANKMMPPLGEKLRVLLPPVQENLSSPMISKNHPDKAKIISDFKRSFKVLVQAGLYDEMYEIHDLRVTHKPISP